MASSTRVVSLRERLNRSWYLGTFVLCLLVGTITLLWIAVASRRQPAPDAATISVPTDEIVVGVGGLLLWLAVLAAVAWWALRAYRRLGASEGPRHDSGR